MAKAAGTEPKPTRKAKAAEPMRPAPDGANRVVIEGVWPEIDGGRSAAKRVAGDRVEVLADIFTDGHDKIAADVLYRREGEAAWSRAPMRLTENDSIIWLSEGICECGA
jgi:starch synthase (maltosyl-transferring)